MSLRAASIFSMVWVRYSVIRAEEKNGATYAIDADSIDWVEPLPEGFEWIEAYFAWARYL
jgi:hypothetical protein